MNTRALPFEKLVQPYYPTLSHFVAAAGGNPLVASILAPAMLKVDHGEPIEVRALAPELQIARQPIAGEPSGNHRRPFFRSILAL
jgi:hypothetical protein